MSNPLTFLEQQQVAEMLIGSCSSPHELVDHFDCLQDYEFTAVDYIMEAARNQDIFLCDYCGWWCNIGEMVEDDICENCYTYE